MASPTLPLGSTSQQQLDDVRQAQQAVTDKGKNYAAEVFATRRPA